MLRRFGLAALVALTPAPALLAQTPATTRAVKPPISIAPWPDDEVLLTRRTQDKTRRFFRAAYDFDLSASRRQTRSSELSSTAVPRRAAASDDAPIHSRGIIDVQEPGEHVRADVRRSDCCRRGDAV